MIQAMSALMTLSFQRAKSIVGKIDNDLFALQLSRADFFSCLSECFSCYELRYVRDMMVSIVKRKMKQSVGVLRPVHMIPGQLIAPGQLTDPGVNFASVHDLTPVTVHIRFLLSRATSRGGLPVVQHLVIRLAEVIFLHVNKTQKLSRGKSSLAHAHYQCLE